MKSIPNLEMPPASGPQPKGDAAADKLELAGKAPGCPRVNVGPPMQARAGQGNRSLAP